MRVIDIQMNSIPTGFGKALAKSAHKNMLEVLKKMHSQDTLTKTGDEIIGTAVCELATNKMKLNTCKLPTVKQNSLSSDEFVKKGQTSFHFASDTIVVVNNEDGKIICFIDGLKQGWLRVKKELSNNIDFMLNNYEAEQVRKQTYSIRTLV